MGTYNIITYNKILCYYRYISRNFVPDILRVLAMDRDAQDNRANQKNTNHPSSGDGVQRGYKGTGDEADLDNHSQQKNMNNDKYQQPKK